MLWKIYVAGVVAMLLTLLFVVPFPKATSRKETSANLLTSASAVVFWPLFLFWFVYKVRAGEPNPFRVWVKASPLADERKI